MFALLLQRLVYSLWAVQGLAYNKDYATLASLADSCDYLGNSEEVDLLKHPSCIQCYNALIPNGSELIPNLSDLRYDVNKTKSFPDTTALADEENGKVKDEICHALGGEYESCRHWLSCCAASLRCCQSQPGDRSGNKTSGYCLRTWDGYVCWNSIVAGKQVRQECPSYLHSCSLDDYLQKSCSAEGEWTETITINNNTKDNTPEKPSIAMQLQSFSSMTSQQPSIKQCRYWEGYVDVDIYKLTTCAYCYKYLFHTGTELVPYGIYLVSVNGTVFPHMSLVRPDITNETTTRKICRTLETETSCRQWLECCEAAEKCCESQLEDESSVAIDAEGGSRECPSTWDGFACWGRLKAGQSVQASCPGYIPHAMPSADAIKTCTKNGTWYRSVDTGKEWTNYTSCLQFEEFRINIYIKLVCNLLSLLTLIPSLVIFLAYRSLRRQHRIRLHINLFSSFVFYAIINILWELLVVYERLNKPTTDTLMTRNTSGCKLLYVLTRFSRSTNFLWMFCEGLYLHRLIVKAFQPPKSLTPFYILGWGLPLVPISIYAVIRLFIRNESCWVHHIGPSEWIVFVPNLVAMGANVVFLIDILRILLTQLQTHPNEPSNYRRALKATFVLVPLFGMQLFLVIYRPPLGSSVSAVYENISAVIVNSQGFLVALVFCLVNGEVLATLKRTCIKHGRYDDTGESRRGNVSVTTQATEFSTKESPTSGHRSQDAKNKYIAMKPMNGSNGYVT